MTTSIAFYLCDGVQLLDLAGPMAALDAANRLLGRNYYRIAVRDATGRDEGLRPPMAERCAGLEPRSFACTPP